MSNQPKEAQHSFRTCCNSQSLRIHFQAPPSHHTSSLATQPLGMLLQRVRCRLRHASVTSWIMHINNTAPPRHSAKLFVAADAERHALLMAVGKTWSAQRAGERSVWGVSAGAPCRSIRGLRKFNKVSSPGLKCVPDNPKERAKKKYNSITLRSSPIDGSAPKILLRLRSTWI